MLAWREALESEGIERVQRRHAEAYRRNYSTVRPLPGAKALLTLLTGAQIPWAIATSGRLETAGPVFEMLDVDPNRHVVITRDDVKYAKPEPDLFLAAAHRLGVDIETASSLATVFGTCSPPAVRGRSVLAFSQAGTVWRNWSAPARTAFTRIPPIF